MTNKKGFWDEFENIGSNDVKPASGMDLSNIQDRKRGDDSGSKTYDVFKLSTGKTPREKGVRFRDFEISKFATVDEVAEWFGYASADSFRSGKRFGEILRGCDAVLRSIKKGPSSP